MSTCEAIQRDDLEPPRQRQVVPGCVLTPSGWRRGAIEFGERILRIAGTPAAGPRSDEAIVLPGFIDLHVHGGGGADVMDAAGAITRIARLHARHGTTALLATTVAAAPEALRAAVAAVGDTMRQRPKDAATVLGVHLEGPYIHRERLGAQPDAVRTADFDELRALHALAPLRVVTLAPELAGHLDIVRRLNAIGVRTQCGHSAGSYEDGVAALMAGMGGFTHLFNAMGAFHHRAPGMVGAALAHAQFAELIPDLLHVHPGAMRCALRAIPRLYCVTDSTAAAGMPDGDYRLGTHTVTKCMGGVRLADGTLAGSTLTMDQALRNLVAIGLELDDAARRLSTYPADYLGESERGRLAHGAWADLVVLDAELQLQAVYIEGASIDLVHA